MNDVLRVIDLLVNSGEDPSPTLEKRDGAELQRLCDTLLKLTRGARPEAVEEAEALRRVVRLHRGA